MGFAWPETEDVDENRMPELSGHHNFMAQVTLLTEKFKGQVLFVHGDTHYFKLDKPLYSPTKLLPNFTRLQTFDSPVLHWVKVTVHSDSEQVFQVTPVIVKQLN